VLLASVSELDDLRVGLRLARPSDAPRVRAFLERLAPETRRRRFGTPQPRISSSLVRHFTFPDPRRRMIVVATAPLEGTERIVGMADAAFQRAALAEIAFVVADELQGRGIGHLLAETVAALAARHGARRLRADISGGGVAALGVMRGLGPTVSVWGEGSSVAYTTLPAPAEGNGREAVGPFRSFRERFGRRAA
jgi:GNAT superfamily N-acetyltransferase